MEIYLVCPRVFCRYARIRAAGSPPAGSGWRPVRQLWRGRRERLHHAAGHHGIHSRAVRQLLEGQPLMPWRGGPGPPRPLCGEFNTKLPLPLTQMFKPWGTMLEHCLKPGVSLGVWCCSAERPPGDLGEEKVCSPHPGALLSLSLGGALPAVLRLVCLWCLWVSVRTDLTASSIAPKKWSKV